MEKDLNVPDIYSDEEGNGCEEESEVVFQPSVVTEEKPKETQVVDLPKQEVTEPSVVESTAASDEEDNYDPFAI